MLCRWAKSIDYKIPRVASINTRKDIIFLDLSELAFENKFLENRTIPFQIHIFHRIGFCIWIQHLKLPYICKNYNVCIFFESLICSSLHFHRCQLKFFWNCVEYYKFGIFEIASHSINLEPPELFKWNFSMI